MKYIHIIVFILILGTGHSVNTAEQYNPLGSKQTTSWFSYFTKPLLQLRQSIASSFTNIINNLFSRQSQPKQYPSQKSISTTPESTSIPSAIEPTEQKEQTNPPFVPIKKPVEQPIEKSVETSSALPQITAETPFYQEPFQETTEEIAQEDVIPEEPTIESEQPVVYNYQEKRLEITTPDSNKQYVNFVDRYELSPSKSYIISSQFALSVGQLAKTGIKEWSKHTIINPQLDKPSIHELTNLHTYQFSPEETQLIILTSSVQGSDFIQMMTGIKAPSEKHAEPTGIIKKTGQLFRYYIYDLTTNKESQPFENVTNMIFNNENEVTIFYEDNAVEVYQFTTNLFGLRAGWQKTDKTAPTASPTINYNPHEKKLTLFDNSSSSVFTDISRFYYSPQRKYILAEKPQSMVDYLSSKAYSMNADIPEIQIIDIKDKTTITNFSDEIHNVITYEFNQEEDVILCKIATSSTTTEYRVFDLAKKSVIMNASNVETAKYAYFSDNNTITIIDENNHQTKVAVERSSIDDDIVKQFQKSTEQITESIKSATEKVKSVTSPAVETMKNISQKAGDIASMRPTDVVSTLTQKAGHVIAPIKEKVAQKIEAVEPFIKKLTDPNISKQPMQEEELKEIDAAIEQYKQEHPELPAAPAKEIVSAQELTEQEEQEVEDIIEQLKKEEIEEDFFSLAIEEHLAAFKKSSQQQNTNETQKIMAEIIQDIQETDDDDKDDMRDAFFQAYQEYPKEMQQLFLSNFLTSYQHQTSENKQLITEKLFELPEGILSDDKSAQDIITNNTQTIIASFQNNTLTIKNTKTDTELGSFSIEEKPLVGLFNQDSTYFALSTHDTATSSNYLMIFTKDSNNTFKIHEKLPQQNKITGLLFLNESTLLARDPENSIYQILPNKTMVQKEGKNTAIQQEIAQKLTIINNETALLKNDPSSKHIHQIIESAHEIQKLSSDIDPAKKQIITTAQNFIADQNSQTYQEAIHTILAQEWLKNKDQIIKTAGTVTLAGLTVAILPALQAATGNVSIDIGALESTMLSAIFANAIAELTKVKSPIKETLRSTSFETISNAIMPYFNSTVSFALPSPRTIITSSLSSIVQTEVQNIIAQHGDVSTLLNTYAKEYLLRNTPSASNSDLQTSISSTTNNSTIKKLLAKIGYTLTTSACIGIGMYVTKVGFNEEATPEQALHNSALRGILQAICLEVLGYSTGKAGALFSIPTIFASSAVVESLTHGSLSSGEMVSAAIAGCATEAVKLLTERADDFLPIFNSVAEAAQKTIKNGWAQTLDFFSDIHAATKSMNIEPINITALNLNSTIMAISK